jgi:protein-disulfide isomerase
MKYVRTSGNNDPRKARLHERRGHNRGKDLARGGFVVALGVLLSISSFAADRSQISKETVEQIVRQYLSDHPEVVMEAIERYQVREAKKRAKRANDALANSSFALYEDPATPVVGSADDAIRIVEFFDYKCGFCRRDDPIVPKILDENPSVQWIFKELPSLGPESLDAAKASLASYRQGAYLQFHEALMSETAPLTMATILGIASRLGLNVAQLKTDMESTNLAIENTHKLAEALQIQATPAFVIGGELILGFLDADELRTRIAKARATK